MTEKSIKKMCKIDKKTMDKRLDDVKESVQPPRYICRKCARSANRKSLLCKPSAFD